VVDGYALGYHGYVRATGDLDLFIEVSDINADRLDSAFKEFGFSHDAIKALFLEKGQMVRIGRPPMRLEILTEISGVDFEACYESREDVELEDFSVSFINLEDLIKNKESTGRSKDKVDVEQLGKHLKQKSEQDEPAID
jgi:predicted nucleotidyltransferase